MKEQKVDELIVLLTEWIGDHIKGGRRTAGFDVDVYPNTFIIKYTGLK